MQFRDIENGSRACYQAIVESPMRLTSGLKAGHLPGTWELKINQYESCKVIDRLGLEASDGIVKPAFQPWAKFDFVLDPGGVIYETTE